MALREGIKVLVVGDVRVAGTGVVLSASVVAPVSGEIIYGASETARDSAELLPAIERLSHSIRERAGESLASIQAGDSLWSFTTSSLPALRKHMAATKAFQRGDFARSAELLSEAIALDPEFAYAHLDLATALENAGQPRGRYLPELARAYALRAGLTDRERYAVEGAYHLRVTGDVGKSIVAFQNHVEELRRTGEGGWYGALGFLLRLTGQPHAAEAILQEARVRFPSAVNQTVLVELLYAMGKDAQADTVLGEVATRFPEHPFVLELRVRVLAHSGGYDAAHALAAGIPSDVGLRLEAELDAVRGRFGEAIAHLRELRDQALARGMLATAVEIAIAAGRLRLRSGDSTGASEIDQLLRRHRFDSIDTLSRPYLPLALFYAEAGQSRQARAWLNRYQREFPAQFRGPDRWMLHRAQAAVYQAEGRPAQALEEFRLAATESPPFGLACSTTSSFLPPTTPNWHGSTTSPVSPTRRWRYMSDTSTAGCRVACRQTPLNLAGRCGALGFLYDRRGDRARAAEQYARLGDLWREADVSVKPLVDAAHRLRRRDPVRPHG